MLIFVQVCRTIDKKLVSLSKHRNWKTNESNGINKKEAWSSEEKKFWRQEVQKKLTSLETLSSSEASSLEAERLKISNVVQMMI